MIISRFGEAFVYKGVKYVIGRPIIATENSEYSGLYGRIMEIRTEKSMHNAAGAPDIYCSFDPPILHDEIAALENTFSDLYEKQQRLEDIRFDYIIMSPELIRMADEEQKNVPIYLLEEIRTVYGETEVSCSAYTDRENGRQNLLAKLKKEWMSGAVSDWKKQHNFQSKSTGLAYECWLDDEETESKYAIKLLEQPLPLSSCFVMKISSQYRQNCQHQDFVSHIQAWSEIKEMTLEQYENLVSDPSIPERIEIALGKNDLYWESYWDSVALVAHELIKGLTSYNQKEEEES